jgi:hypothetical protein
VKDEVIQKLEGIAKNMRSDAQKVAKSLSLHQFHPDYQASLRGFEKANFLVEVLSQLKQLREGSASAHIDVHSLESLNRPAEPIADWSKPQCQVIVSTKANLLHELMTLTVDLVRLAMFLAHYCSFFLEKPGLGEGEAACRECTNASEGKGTRYTVESNTEVAHGVQVPSCQRP